MRIDPIAFHGRSAWAKAPAAAVLPGVRDVFIPSVGVPVARAAADVLAAVARAAWRVAGALLPMPAASLAFFGFGSAPAGLPRDLYHALDEDEAATRAVNEQIQRLRASDADREAITHDYAHALRRGSAAIVANVLHDVDGRADAAAAFHVFVELLNVTRDDDRARADHAALLNRGGSIPLAEAAGHTLALRHLDRRYYNDYGAWHDIGPALDFVLQGSDAPARLERRQDVEFVLHQGRDFDSALAHAQRLATLHCPPAQRALVRHAFQVLVKKYHDDDPGLRLALDRIDDPKDAAGAVARFHRMLDATKRPAQAISDLDLAAKQAAAHNVPAEEVTQSLDQLRRHDPARGDDYGTFANLSPTLDWQLAPPSRRQRAARLEALLALQQRGRTAPQAQSLEEAVLAVPGDDLLHADLHEHVRGLAKHWTRDHDDAIREALAQSAGPDARAIESAFERLIDATKRPEQAVSDLHLARAEANARALPLDEAVEHACAMRRADPAHDDEYATFNDIHDAMHVTLSASSPQARRRALDDLLSIGARTGVAAALPLLQKLQALRCSDAQRKAISDDLHHALKKFGTGNGDALSALGEADGPADPDAVFHAWYVLAEVTGRTSQALDDLRLVKAQAAAASTPRDAVLDAVVRLRKADPASRDDYESFADLAPVLDALLSGHPSAEALRIAVEQFTELQTHGRNASHALQHAKALAALQVPPERAGALRKTYRGLLKQVGPGHDDALLAALAEAARHGDPLGGLRAFERLLDGSQRLALASEDLARAYREAAARKLDLGECVDLLYRLRRHDPARGEPYGNFQSIDRALSESLQPASHEARAAQAERLVDVQRMGRTLDAAVDHLGRLDALEVGADDAEAIRGTYRKLLKKGRASDDSLLAMLDFAQKQPQPRASVEAFRDLLEVSKRGEVALDDLKLVASTAAPDRPAEEMTELLSRMRAADPNLENGYSNYADLSAALQTVCTAADPATRLGLATAYATLLEVKSEAPSALRDLQWIQAAPLPRGDYRDAARKLAWLDERLNGDDPRHALFDHMQAAATKEHPRWWERLFRRKGEYERATRRVTAMTRDADRVLTAMDALTQGRMAGESLPHAERRLEKLARVYDSDYPELGEATQALGELGKPLAFGDWTDGSRWEYFFKMAHDLQSVKAARTLWRCMAAAPDAGEFQARHDAYSRLTGLAGEHALAAYDALTRTLGPGEKVMDLMPELEALIEKQPAPVAAETFVVLRGTRGMAEGDRKRVHDVLTRAQEPEEIRELFARLQSDVAGETLAVRGDMLGALLAGEAAGKAVQAYDRISKELAVRGELTAVGPAYAGLVGVLAQRGDEQAETEAATLMAWLREQRGEIPPEDPPADPPQAPPADATPLADLILEATNHLLMGADLDRTREQIRLAEERRRRERSGQGPARIERSEDSVDVGGIKVPVRKGE